MTRPYSTPRKPLPPDVLLVECPDCEATFPARSGEIWTATEAHNRVCQGARTTAPQPREGTMSAPLKAVTLDENKRPHPKALLDHPDAKIRRAAQKVMDAVARLDEVWADNAEKAELRATEQRLKAELAKVQKQLRGGAPAKPKVTVNYDAKAVRAWAAATGHEVAPVGLIPKAVLQAYNAANGDGAA